MKSYTLLLIFAGSFLFLIGCSPPKIHDTDIYSVENKRFVNTEPNAVDKMLYIPDTNIELQTLINLLTADAGEYTFQPMVVTGKTDWDFLSEQWQYQRDNRIYLKKITLEIETNTPLFSGRRVIFVHLNKDTLYIDENSLGYIDFRGRVMIRLTDHIGIATFKGDILDVPTQ